MHCFTTTSKLRLCFHALKGSMLSAKQLEPESHHHHMLYSSAAGPAMMHTDEMQISCISSA